MKVMLSRGVPPQKESKPLLQAKEQSQSFFGKNIRKKEESAAGSKGKEEEKVQKKEEPKKEEEKVQKKEEPKKEEEKVQKKEEPKKEEEKVKNKLRKKNASEAKVLRKEASDGNRQLPRHLEEKLLATKGKGFSLPLDIKNEMETKFNADFSQIIIHTDNDAALMADELGALAFTHGKDIYFANGQFVTNTNEGKKLLAHELTHTLQ